MTGQRFVKKLRQCQRVIAALDSSFDLRRPSTQHDIVADIIQPLHSHRFTKGGEGGKKVQVQKQSTTYYALKVCFLLKAFL